jgi:monovalent cation:H+ antiporter-2, CPA2 family
VVADETALGLIQLGAVFFGLGLLGRLAARIGLSPIPLYLIGGLVFGTGGLVELHHVDQFIHLASEIGVVLLLLLLGLEYTADELVTSMRRSWTAGVVDLVANATPGVVVALVLGWGLTGAVAMAGVTVISSSGIVAKILNDFGRLGNRETPAILSILVFEDLAMAAYLPLLTAVLAGVGFLTGATSVAIALIAVSVVLVIALRYGKYVSMLIDSHDREIFLLTLLGSALLVAGMATVLQVSAAVGAFLLGIAISGTTAESARTMLEPLRDLFAALFFVLFGLSTDPKSIPPVLGWACVLVVVTVLTKVGTGWWAAARAGASRYGRLRAGTSLVAHGEFSIVIAGLAVSAGAVPAEFAAMAGTYVLLMAVLGPIAARFAEPVLRRLERPRAPAV